MGRKRVHEVAKELAMNNADLIQKITEWGIYSGKITASSGLEEYQIQDIKDRLSGKKTAATGTVVRRRKKAVSPDSSGPQEIMETRKDSQEDMPPQPQQPLTPEFQAPPLSDASSAAAAGFYDVDPKEAAASKTASGSKAETTAARKSVVIKDVTVNRARVVRPPAPLRPERKPDFRDPVVAENKALAPAGVPRFSDSEPPAAAQAARPALGEAEAKAGPAPAGAASATSAAETAAVPESAGRSARSSKFEPAKIVGMVKPNWGPQASRAGAGPGGPARRGTEGAETGRQPSVGPRNGGPFRSLPQSAQHQAGRPVSAARPEGFRRPEMAPIIPPPEEESRRRGGKKKKSRGFEAGDSDFSAGRALGRRREIIERADIYSADGAWEKPGRGRKVARKKQEKLEPTLAKAIKRRIKISEVITVVELAKRLSVKAGDIIKVLLGLGVVANLNQALDYDTAVLVASEFNYEVDKADFDEENVLGSTEAEVAEENLAPRPPVVTIMGHVDHGKTSLLDYIRKTNIQAGEAGGITQHIGAYHVKVADRQITFLDTPGHEAFTSMRSRGAQVTDIVVLIVAADDGVMPQTREAADHARAARVPIIVAVNKIDKPDADPEKIRRQMGEIGLTPDAWGGDSTFVDISAKSGQGVPELLEMILLQADIMNLKARPSGRARGRIIESRLDKGRGPVATVLIQEGELRTGDPYVCGVFYGKARALFDDQGRRVTAAGPSVPVEIQGLSGVPQAGDEFISVQDEKQARQVSQNRLLKQREADLSKSSKLTLENLFDNIKAGAIRDLNLVVKTDVHGSLEAIVEALGKLSTPEIKVNLIHQSTGAVSETDVMLASASRALIIGFGVRPTAKVQELADHEGVEIRYYDIIYKLIDEVKEAMAGLLDPVRSEKNLGQAEVREVFNVSKVGVIAGCYVTSGKMQRGAKARLLRDGVVIYEGQIASLRRLKDDVREVVSGYECGIGLERYNDIKIGDVIEAYLVEEKAATVELIEAGLEKAQKESRPSEGSPGE